MSDSPSHLDETPSDPVSTLVFECLELLQSEGVRGVDALLSEHPEVAEKVRARLEKLGGLGFIPEGSTEDEHPQRLGPVSYTHLTLPTICSV